MTGFLLTVIAAGCDQGTNEKEHFFIEENVEESSVDPKLTNLKAEEQLSEAMD